MHDSGSPCADLAVRAEDAGAYEILPGRLDRGVLILCDHAGNALPPEYGTLGLCQEDRARHIAFDIGAAGVTRALSASLGAPAILTRYSRLLIDCNRGLDDPTLIMRLSDGAAIAGNRRIDAAERAKRIALYYEPYHRAIEDAIGRAIGAGHPPLVLSVHSYTASWKGVPRPWHAAVLWDKDPRLALPLIEALSAGPGIAVGDNEPYTGRLKGDTMWRHGTSRGLPHAIVEIRQDLIADPKGEAEWGLRLARVLEGLLARHDIAHDLRSVSHYGSHTD